jgi:hypothetical protein
VHKGIKYTNDLKMTTLLILLILLMTVCHPAYDICILAHTSVYIRGGELVAGCGMQSTQSVTVLP